MAHSPGRSYNSTMTTNFLLSSSSSQDNSSVSDNININNSNSSRDRHLHHDYASQNKRQKRKEKKQVPLPPLDSNELCRLHGGHTWGDCFLNPDGRNYRVFVNGNPMAFTDNSNSGTSSSTTCRPTIPSSIVSSPSTTKRQPQDDQQQQKQCVEKNQLPWDVVDILVNDLRKGIHRKEKEEKEQKEEGSSLPTTVRLWPVPKNDMSLQVEADNHKNTVCQEEHGNFLLGAGGGGDDRSVAVSISSHSNDSINGGETTTTNCEQQHQKPTSIEIKHSNNNNIGNNSHPNIQVEEGGEIDDYEMRPSSFEALWNCHYKLLLDFRQKMGHADVSQKYENKKLAGWVKRQRRQYALMVRGKQSSLTPERIQKLESLGFVWDSHELTWREKIEFLKEFRQKHGHCNVGANYKENKLGLWVKCQRRQYKLYKDGKLSSMDSHRIQELNELGFQWKLRDRKSPGT